MLNLVMLGHRKRTGKDTLAEVLVEREGYLRVAFADKLKDIVGDLYRLSPEQLNGNLKEKIDPRYGQTPRAIMQRFGVFGREVYDKTWVDYVLYTTIANGVKAGYKNFVCTDLRFENEHTDVLKWAETSGFKVTAFRVDRPSLPPLDVEDHISETALRNYQGFDAVIINPWDGVSLGREAMEQLYKNFKEAKRSLDKNI